MDGVFSPSKWHIYDCCAFLSRIFSRDSFSRESFPCVSFPLKSFLRISFSLVRVTRGRKEEEVCTSRTLAAASLHKLSTKSELIANLPVFSLYTQWRAAHVTAAAQRLCCCWERRNKRAGKKKEGRAGGTYFNPLSVDCTRRLLLGYIYRWLSVGYTSISNIG